MLFSDFLRKMVKSKMAGFIMSQHMRPKFMIREIDQINDLCKCMNDLCKRTSDLCKRIRWDVTT